MNSPAPGWLPDPTGRHEHRYWDGSYWTSDVSDGGVTSFDPYDATAQQPQTGFGAPTPSGQGYGSSPGYGQPQGFGSGPYGAQPPSSGGGPSTGLLVGLGAAILVVIVAIVLVATNKDDDKDGDTIASGDETSQDDTTDTTATPDDSGDDSGDSSGSHSESDQVMIDAMATGILGSSNGALTQEDADCIAAAMFDELGLERLIEIGGEASEGGSADPLGGLTSDEFSGVMDAMLGCVDAETLAEIGMDGGG
jgi:hypothetical protein